MHAGSIGRSRRTPVRSRVAFRSDAAQGLAERHGLRTIAEIAAWFGTTETTYSRVVRKKTQPGEAFIAAVLTSPAAAAYPDEVTFDGLFIAAAGSTS